MEKENLDKQEANGVKPDVTKALFLAGCLGEKELDIKKICQTVNNQWDAIHHLVKAEQRLIDAIHIMESIVKYPDEMDYHKKRIELFIEQFEKKIIE